MSTLAWDQDQVETSPHEFLGPCGRHVPMLVTEAPHSFKDYRRPKGLKNVNLCAGRLWQEFIGSWGLRVVKKTLNLFRQPMSGGAGCP